MNLSFGYARVSTSTQTTNAQLDDLVKAGCDEIFEETASGSNKDRPELRRMLARVRTGDTVVVTKLDRLSRSLRDLLETIDHLENVGANLKCLHEASFDTTTPNGKLIFRIFASLAEFERELNRERTLEGLAAAKRRGKVLGRREALNEDQKANLVTLRRDGQSLNQLARTFGVSKSTVIRHLQNSGC